MLSATIWNANHYFTINEKEAGIFIQIHTHILYIYIYIIALFSCRECQTLSSDMRIIILLLIMKEAYAFLRKLIILERNSHFYANTQVFA